MVLGVIFSALTFPGVILHEYAHAKLCNKLGVDVYEIVYLRLGNPMGYVKHAEPKTFKQSFGITAAPFLINTVAALGIYITFAAFAESAGLFDMNTETMSIFTQIAFLIPVWLGFSFAAHAIPSSGDAKNLWRFSRKSNNLSAKLGLPISALIYTLDKLRFFWIDAIYAIFLWALTGAILDVMGIM